MSQLGSSWYHSVDSVLSSSQKNDVEKVYESYTFSTVCENIGILVSEHDIPGEADLNNLESNLDSLLALLDCSGDAEGHGASSDVFSRYSITENFIAKYSKA